MPLGAAEPEFHPLTVERLADLARFTERRGSAGNGRFAYCSCMRWRLASGRFRSSTPAERQESLRQLVQDGVPVGILGYLAGEPVGWCSVAPRSTYAALERHRGLPRLDQAPVWAVVCFFVNRRARGHGLTLGLLSAAVDYALSGGATVVEGYPVGPGGGLYRYMGSPSIFRLAGFRDVTPSGQARRVVRFRA